MIRTPQVRQKPLGGNIMQHPFEDRITMRRTHRYVLRGTGELGLNLCIPKGNRVKGPYGGNRLWSSSSRGKEVLIKG